MTTSTTERRTALRSRITLGDALSRYGVLIFLLLMIAVFALLMPDRFLTSANIQNVLSQNAVPGILALAAILPLAAGEFDLSIAANLGMTAILGVVLADQGVAPLFVALITVLVGTAVGAVNAFFVVALKVNAFVATLAMSTILAGLNLVLSSSTLVSVVDEAFTSLARTPVLGIQIVFFYFLVLALVMWFLLERSPFGRYLRATGMGRDAAVLSGVRVNRYLTAAFVGAGLLAGIAGFLQGSRAASATPNLGPEFLLPAYAAAFLGAAAIRPGYFNVAGTVVGVFLLAVGANGLSVFGAPTWVTHVFNGAALLVAVSTSGLVKRRRTARPRSAAAPPDDPPPGGTPRTGFGPDAPAPGVDDAHVGDRAVTGAPGGR